MPNLFAEASSWLLGENAGEIGNTDVGRLLEALGYTGATQFDEGGVRSEALHRGRLLKTASRFKRVFELAAPDAPGMISFGAEFDPALADPLHVGLPIVGVSGVGLSLQEAFQGCIGEGIEYLSQLQTTSDVLESPGQLNQMAALARSGQDFLGRLAVHRQCPEADLLWHRVTRLSDHCEALLPADLCLRRPPAQQQIKPPFPLSTGSAAGQSWDAAALHGMLELIERDAASLWWIGGSQGKSIPPEDEAAIIAQTLLAQLRAGPSARRSWLLDITTDIGVPSVAAVSCNPDGFGLASGLAARPTLGAAVRAAILEMCQCELAYAVVEAKVRERGETVLNAPDRIHRRRATVLNADRCPLLQPSSQRARHLQIGPTDPSGVLRSIVGRLGELGFEVFGLDLTRQQFAIPVARILAPGLQPLPSEIITPRLAHKIAQTGGGATYTSGIALI